MGAYELPIAEKCCSPFPIPMTKIRFMAICLYGKTTHWFWSVDLGQKTEQARFAFRTALRYQYDDNTTATVGDVNWIPSLFVQDEVKLMTTIKFYWARYDYNNNHGSIFTPRLAYKWKINDLTFCVSTLEQALE
jgi:outer membrane receptor for ferrienterochelin and colicins